MNYFDFRDGKLFAENVEVSDIAKEVGTPFYCYSKKALVGQYGKYQKAFSDLNCLICFAVKANSNLSVLRAFGELKAGADVVSVGEIQRALEAGIDAKKIVFAGVGKARGEI